MIQEEMDQLQKKAPEQVKTGKSLFGKDGAFAPMLKPFLASALEAEVEEHLSLKERRQGNKGKGKNTCLRPQDRQAVRSAAGLVEIQPPRGRQSGF